MSERTSAGLDRCTPEEAERLVDLNARYRERYGFPFVMAVRGRDRHQIMTSIEARLDSTAPAELERAIAEIDDIARLRLNAMLATSAARESDVESVSAEPASDVESVSAATASLDGKVEAPEHTHFFLGTFIGRLRGWLSSLVSGLVVLMIGLALVKVGIQYAAGGVPSIGKPEYGTWTHWGLALVVIVVTLVLKFFARGMLSVSTVLLGLLAGYDVAYGLGMMSFANVERAVWFAPPDPFHFGIEFNVAAIIGMCLMGVISARHWPARSAPSRTARSARTSGSYR